MYKEKIKLKKISVLLALIIAVSFTGCKDLRSEEKNDNKTLPTFENTQTDLILSAKATTEFSDEVVTNAQIEKLLTAALNSPYYANSVPWHFTTVMKEGYIKELVPNATKGCVIIIVSTPYGDTFNSAIAAQSMNLAAQSMGLGANMYFDKLNSINSEDLRNSYKIPDGYSASCVVCVGYAKDGALSYKETDNNLKDYVTYID